MPIPSPFVRLAGHWVDDALSFAMGWNFFFTMGATDSPVAWCFKLIWTSTGNTLRDHSIECAFDILDRQSPRGCRRRDLYCSLRVGYVWP